MEVKWVEILDKKTVESKKSKLELKIFDTEDAIIFEHAYKRLRRIAYAKSLTV